MRRVATTRIVLRPGKRVCGVLEDFLAPPAPEEAAEYERELRKIEESESEARRFLGII